MAPTPEKTLSEATPVIPSNATAVSHPPELLAPAGDWDALQAGLAAGADAIYLGGKSFSARQSAANFDLEQLKAAAVLLHLHRRRIYVTVNTLIGEAELPAALDYLAELYNLGVDAVIVQDLGLVTLARQYLPRLELHASTQMTVHNREGAMALQERGISRIVLARELTRAEVAAIAAHTGMDLEVFVHGALCVCYSGQCLMSSMIGGRSGNRGRCAQPCRLEYQLMADGTSRPTKGSYLLSPKDLALAELIPDLARAGVRSLKIEGRMKRPEYVYGVVAVYRRLLDRFQAQPDAFQVGRQDCEELEQAFNRGFSTGYFGGQRNRGIIGLTRPNNRGVYLGRIQKAQQTAGTPARYLVTLKLEASLMIGDEVEVWISQGGRQAVPVRELERDGQKIATGQPGDTVSFTLPGKTGPGDRVFKVFSRRLNEETARALADDNPAVKIDLTAHLEGRLGAPLRLTFRDDAGHSGGAASATPLQTAKTRPLTGEVITAQLGRLGNTPFRLARVTTDLDSNVMAPLSELNQLRREALEELTTALLKPYRRAQQTEAPWKGPGSGSDGRSFPTPLVSHAGQENDPKLSAWVADLKSVRAVAPSVAQIYVGGDELTGFHWTADAYREARQIAREYHSRLIIGLPRINREEHRAEWHALLDTALAAAPDGIMVAELGSYFRALRETGTDLYLNYPLNFFNGSAIRALAAERVRQVTLSPELTLAQIRALHSQNRRLSPQLQLECLGQGSLELMVSEYCPIGSVAAADTPAHCGGECPRSGAKHQYALRDRLGLDFPVCTDQFCRMHLFNCKELCMYGDLPDLYQLAGMVWRLELKIHPAETAGKIAAQYRMLLECLKAGNGLPDLNAGVDNLVKMTGRGITKGHYFRGVE